jgi:hypothetical protein
MHRRNFVNLTFFSLAGLHLAPDVIGQQKTVEPDLSALANAKVLTTEKCCLGGFEDGKKKGVHLSHDGIAYITGVEFSNGSIEVEMRGKDVEEQSFMGVAFHGVDRNTYDVIYFRPFNFKTEDAARRMRAVQYAAYPAYTSQNLRAEHPGKYEQPVNSVLDPDDWFHARVVVESPKVSVFVNHASEPCLAVTQLSDRKKGLVGVWGSGLMGGDFANFKIAPA